MGARYVFFDVADTLLVKPELVGTLAGILQNHGERVDELAIRRNHKILSECLPFPVRTSAGFYDQFNRELLLSLGILPTDALLGSIYECLRLLEWRAAADSAALDELRVPVGIVSNFDATLEDRLRTLLPTPFFRIVSSHLAGTAKPSPELFRMALQGLDCSPGEVAYVGDSLKLDVVPAQAVGMKAILVDRYDLFPGYRGARARSLYEVPRLLDVHE